MVWDGTPGGIGSFAGTGGGVGGGGKEEIPSSSTPNLHFGASFGQVTASGGPQRLINGLTISQYIRAYAPAANTKQIVIGDKNVTPTFGFLLEAGKDVTLDTGCTRDRWWVISQDGSNQTVTYATASNQEML